MNKILTSISYGLDHFALNRYLHHGRPFEPRFNPFVPNHQEREAEPLNQRVEINRLEDLPIHSIFDDLNEDQDGIATLKERVQSYLFSGGSLGSLYEKIQEKQSKGDWTPAVIALDVADRFMKGELEKKPSLKQLVQNIFARIFTTRNYSSTIYAMRENPQQIKYFMNAFVHSKADWSSREWVQAFEKPVSFILKEVIDLEKGVEQPGKGNQSTMGYYYVLLKTLGPISFSMNEHRGRREGFHWVIRIAKQSMIDFAEENQIEECVQLKQVIEQFSWMEIQCSPLVVGKITGKMYREKGIDEARNCLSNLEVYDHDDRIQLIDAFMTSGFESVERIHLDFLHEYIEDALIDYLAVTPSFTDQYQDIVLRFFRTKDIETLFRGCVLHFMAEKNPKLFIQTAARFRGEVFDFKLNCANSDSNTPLHCLINSEIESDYSLLDFSRFERSMTHRNQSNFNPLQLAFKLGDIKMMKGLVAFLSGKQDISMGIWGWDYLQNPLALYLEYVAYDEAQKDGEIIELIYKSLEKRFRADKLRISLIRAAVKGGKPEAIIYLIQKKKVKVDPSILGAIVRSRSLMSLPWDRLEPLFEKVKFLPSRFERIRGKKSNVTIDLLTRAYERNYPEVFQWLLEKGQFSKEDVQDACIDRIIIDESHFVVHEAPMQDHPNVSLDRFLDFFNSLPYDFEFSDEFNQYSRFQARRFLITMIQNIQERRVIVSVPPNDVEGFYSNIEMVLKNVIVMMEELRPTAENVDDWGLILYNLCLAGRLCAGGYQGAATDAYNILRGKKGMNELDLEEQFLQKLGDYRFRLVKEICNEKWRGSVHAYNRLLMHLGESRGVHYPGKVFEDIQANIDEDLSGLTSEVAIRQFDERYKAEELFQWVIEWVNEVNNKEIRKTIKEEWLLKNSPDWFRKEKLSKFEEQILQKIEEDQNDDEINGFIDERSLAPDLGDNLYDFPLDFKVFKEADKERKKELVQMAIVEFRHALFAADEIPLNEDSVQSSTIRFMLEQFGVFISYNPRFQELVDGM